MALALRRQRALQLAGPLVVLLASSGAACSAVLGLSAPTLDPCANGCVDGSAPTTDASDDAPDVAADAVGLPDTSAPPEAEASVESPDAESDGTDDQFAPNGVRCGAPTLGLYCAGPASCCLSLADDGGAAYSCAASEDACENENPVGYPIECASDNDCSGNDVCCFFSSGIKCDSNDTCNSSPLVCDPTVPASEQCASGQKCSAGNLTRDGYTLPYSSCN